MFYSEQKTFTNSYALFPLHYEQLRPWEVCSINDLGQWPITKYLQILLLSQQETK